MNDTSGALRDPEAAFLICVDTGETKGGVGPSGMLNYDRVLTQRRRAILNLECHDEAERGILDSDLQEFVPRDLL